MRASLVAALLLVSCAHQQIQPHVAPPADSKGAAISGLESVSIVALGLE